MTKKITGIIFDFDNTLVKSHINFPALKIAMAQVARSVGLDFGKDEEIPHKYTAGQMITEAETFDNTDELNLVTNLWKLVEDHERKGMVGLTIDDEVFSMLNFLLEKKYTVTLLTNNSREPTLEVLKKYDMEKYFQLVIAREDVSKMKPDKEGLDLILNKLSLNREESVFIGDSWVDGQAAKNANVLFILFRDEFLSEEKYDIAIWQHIKTMNELVELLKKN
ncbi:MAG: HAD family hydrolase [Candidatus Heimdallarchaeota archaeon]